MRGILLGWAVLAVISADAAQWKLETSGNKYGFRDSVWRSLEDSSITTTTLTDQDECFVLNGKYVYGGYSDQGIFYGKSLTLGSIADGNDGYYYHYYSEGIYGTSDNEVKNDGLILERGGWMTEYGDQDKHYRFYGKVTVNATVDNPFRIYRTNSPVTTLELKGEVQGAGWLAVKGFKAPMYTLALLGGYSNFSGGIHLVADSEKSTDSVSCLLLPSGTCTASIIADTGCQLITESVAAQVSLGGITLADGAVLVMQANGTGATAATRVLTNSKFTATSGFSAAGSVKVEVAYTDSANGKFDDAFDLLTVPASVAIDAGSFVFVPTDANHPSANFSVRDDGDTKTLVMTYVGSGAELLTQAEDGTNAKGIEGVKWSDGSVGTSSDYNYACVGYEIYISSSDDTKNDFKGNSLRIGDATSGKNGTLQEYGGFAAVKQHAIMDFPNDGLILACGVWSVRYATSYYLTGKIKVTATPEKPFRLYNSFTKTSSGPYASDLTWFGPLTGSGALQIDNGCINQSWITNFCVKIFGGANDFTGTLLVTSQLSNVGCYGRAGIALTNAVYGGSYEITDGSYLVAPELGETAYVSRLTLDEGSEVLIDAKSYVNGGEPATSTGLIDVTGQFAVNGPVTLTVRMANDQSAGGDFVLLSVPYETMLDLTQFQLNLLGDTYFAAGAELKEQVGETSRMLVLSIPHRDIVIWKSAANDGDHFQIASQCGAFQSSMTNADNWSDGELPHSGAHYLCQTVTGVKNLRTESYGVGTAGTFPGESLTLEGSAYAMEFTPMHAEYTIPHLRLKGYTGIYPCTSGVILHADIEAEDGSSFWQPYAGSLFKIDGRLTGAGTIEVVGNGSGSGNPGGDVEFAGDNSGYSGRLRIYITPSDKTPSMDTDRWGVRCFERVFAGNGNSMGGAMSPADPRGVILEACSQFIPRQSMTIDVPTRGWQIVSNGRFNVTDAAQVLTFKSPLALYGALYKEGPGRLELGNAEVTFGEDATETSPSSESSLNRFVVSEGSVKILAANCLNGVDIVVKNGSTPAFVMSLDTEDADLIACGLKNDLANTPFAVEGDGQKVIFTLEGQAPSTYPATFALCTVAAAKADAVEALLQLQAPTFAGMPRVPATLVRGEETAGLVTFSVRLEAPKGTCVIVK